VHQNQQGAPAPGTEIFREEFARMNFRSRVQLLKLFSLLMVLLTVAPLSQQWFGFGPLTIREIFWNSVALFAVGVVALVFGAQHALALSRARR
jgi:hypothetical protein